jgi:mannitol-1-phosphate 5-dehydrogenase
LSHTFVGFGFGAIQGGLFLPEAFRSGNFSRLVVSEIDAESVAALRAAEGTYFCNVAGSSSVETICVEGVEILNPLVDEDRKVLVRAMSEASELATALPSFTLYDVGEASVAALLAEAFSMKVADPALPTCVTYAAENDSRAASRLRDACLGHAPVGFGDRVQFSETVIAKMCSVVADPVRIADEGLAPIVPDFPRAFLVESFNEILVDQVTLPNFERGLSAFLEKPDLDPFAMTKFLGHNANHALLGYLAREQGLGFMHEAGEREDLMTIVQEAFLEESGVGLRHKYSEMDDELFTEEGFRAYAEDAVTRMVSPFLRDPVDRVTRDPARKLGWEDRLVGSMRLASEAGVKPNRLARGVAIALECLCEETGQGDPEAVLSDLWRDAPEDVSDKLVELVFNSRI